MANIRIKDLPKATPALSSDYFVFEKSMGGGNYTTSADLLTAVMGAQGLQGLQGNLGNQGTQGIQGIQGRANQGLQGNFGNQGIQGLSNQGVQGSFGNQGTQGIQGNLGIQGNFGAQGTQGLAVQGAQNTQGTQGNLGIQGSLGTQGTQGLAVQGTQNTQGTQGTANQGVQGPAGTTQGTQGSEGNIGLQGNQGVQGISSQGVQGIQGLQNTQGTQGAANQGVQGPAGATQGTQGDQGVQGILGYQGIQGLQSTQGTLGDQGIQGTLGNQGLQGDQGVQGNFGNQGLQGDQGVQGLSNQGVQGLSNQGVQGPVGATGAMGQSSSYYQYLADTSDTSTPPAAGDIRWNNVTQQDSTAIHASHLTSDGVDIDIFLALLKQNDIIIIQDKNNSANYQKWSISGTPTIVDNSYVSLPVTLINSTHSFSNNDQLILAIATTGLQGATGTQGLQGLSNQGVQGSIGLQGNYGEQGIQGVQGISNQGVQGIIGTTFDYTLVSSNITLESNNGYIFDTTTGAITVTLPATPSVGAYINITLTRGGGNNLIIQRNSSNINSLPEDLTCDVTGTFSLVYTDATTGWKFIPFSGLTYAPATLIIDTITNSRLLQLTDSSEFIRVNSSNPVIVTVPNNSNVPFQNGTQISIMRLGTGAVTLSAQSPVNLRSVENKVTIRAQSGVATVVRLSADDWALFGDIA